MSRWRWARPPEQDIQHRFGGFTVNHLDEVPDWLAHFVELLCAARLMRGARDEEERVAG